MNFEESYYDDDAIGGKAASGNKGSSHFFNKQKEDRYIHNPNSHFCRILKTLILPMKMMSWRNSLDWND